MKKIISLGIASAICALTAISASAAAGSKYGAVEGEIAKDKEIKVSLIAAEDIKNISFMVTTDGLEVVDVKDNGSTKLAFYTPDTKKFRAQPMTADGVYAKKGDTVCTFTLKVTAESGLAKLSLADETGKFTALLPDAELKLDVKGAVTSDTPSGTTSGETSGTTSGTTSGETSGTTSGGENKPNPDTGVALAVIPAVLAAAGVIVAKKRK